VRGRGSGETRRGMACGKRDENSLLCLTCVNII
jgi:hypothetical protein